MQLFEGMEHGWTLRGDAKDPKVGPNITEAFDRANAWFKKYLWANSAGFTSFIARFVWCILSATPYFCWIMS